MNDLAWLERRMGARLLTVAAQVEGPVVADVGPDHGYLPAYLLRSGRCQRVIAIDRAEAPLERARRAVGHRPVDFRLGNGLEPLGAGEADCLTMCGFGGREMEAVLRAHPERVPGRVVAQPQGSAGGLRAWALDAGYQLVFESAGSPWVVLTFRRSESV